MTRSRRHGLLAAVCAGACGLAWLAGERPVAWDRVSITTAYACLVLLSVGLAVGPGYALRSGRPVLNNRLRRDINIWAALMGLIHLVVATELSMTPSYVASFVNLPAEPMRGRLFAWGSSSGFLVGLNFLLLLALSNDWSLRQLGAVWWKRLHRTSYLGFALTILHGLAFQILEGRAWPLIGALLLVASGVGVMQTWGVLAVRRGHKGGV